MNASVDEGTTRRRIERHGAATIRALGAHPGAEWRGHTLRVDDRIVPIGTPYLVAPSDGAAASDDRWRGIADGLGLLVRHSDLDLHRSLSPSPLLQRIVFDALEQLRCDSLAEAHLRGVRANLAAAFDGWSQEARASRVAESRTGLLVFTVVHMGHARLMGRPLPEDVDELTESTRFHLAPVIGHALRELPRLTGDQARYAEAAAEIARLVDEVAGDATDSEVVESASRHRLVVPLEWTDDGDELRQADGPGTSPRPDGSTTRGTVDLDRLGGYSVFTRAHDLEVTGSSLYRVAQLERLRRALDAMESAQAVSTPRLASRLLRLFGAFDVDDWAFGRDEGALDGRRLSQLVANPQNHELFKRQRLERTGNTVVAFLIDNSGSMKRQRFEAVAVLVDTFSRALDLAGISNEVLGFTTASWAGGRPIDEWRVAGEPDRPGRMNEAMHIVYKDADTSWRGSRLSLAALASPQHFREGLDGEALAWAYRRLTSRPEPRKVLVMISDGSPTDAATANVNPPGFLDDHLVAVADRIERSRAGQPGHVELGAIGIDEHERRDMSPYVRRSIDLDLTGTLTLPHYQALHRLFT